MAATLHGVEGQPAPEPVVTGTLRRDDGGPSRLLASSGRVCTCTASRSTGPRFLPTRPAPRPAHLCLPASAVLARHRAAGADVVSAGLGPVGQPLLGAVIEMADGEALVFTGRLSLRSHPWLADHEMGGTVFFPRHRFRGARRGRRGSGGLHPDRRADDGGAPGAVRARCCPGPGRRGWRRRDGHRTVEVFARPVDAGVGWTRHAAGRVAPPDRWPSPPTESSPSGRRPAPRPYRWTVGTGPRRGRGVRARLPGLRRSGGVRRMSSPRSSCPSGSRGTPVTSACTRPC